MGAASQLGSHSRPRSVPEAKNPIACAGAPGTSPIEAELKPRAGLRREGEAGKSSSTACSRAKQEVQPTGTPPTLFRARAGNSSPGARRGTQCLGPAELRADAFDRSVQPSLPSARLCPLCLIDGFQYLSCRAFCRGAGSPVVASHTTEIEARTLSSSLTRGRFFMCLRSDGPSAGPRLEGWWDAQQPICSQCVARLAITCVLIEQHSVSVLRSSLLRCLRARRPPDRSLLKLNRVRSLLQQSAAFLTSAYCSPQGTLRRPLPSIFGQPDLDFQRPIRVRSRSRPD